MVMSLRIMVRVVSMLVATGGFSPRTGLLITIYMETGIAV